MERRWFTESQREQHTLSSASPVPSAPPSISYAPAPEPQQRVASAQHVESANDRALFMATLVGCHPDVVSWCYEVLPPTQTSLVTHADMHSLRHAIPTRPFAPHVIITDLSLHQSHLQSHLHTLQAAAPQVAIVGILAPQDYHLSASALALGVQECVEKRTSDGKTFFQVLQRATTRQRYVTNMTAMLHTQQQRLQQLTEAYRMKSEFLSMMSHELRTPLNIMIGYGDLLLQEEFGTLTAAQRDPVGRMQESAKGLYELIASTLAFNRIEHGHLTLLPREVHPHEFIDTVRQEVTPLLTEHSPQLIWDVPANLPVLHTDAGMLKVVLKNLVTNALKFTEQGSITIRAHSDATHLSIDVRDTGIGMSAAECERVFEPFCQAAAAQESTEGGVGLGLYIVRQFLLLLGGSIAVRSRVGHGTTFRVRLPRHSPRMDG